MLFGNKRTLFFCFLPYSFYRLLINFDLKEENVRHGSFGISFQIEKCFSKGYAWNSYFLLPARKKKSPIMLDYQGFAWFFFCFQWSAWVMNQTLFLPQYQYFQKFRLCTRHALVLKNCLLLSGVCLPTSWVQMYALFLNYANRWK